MAQEKPTNVICADSEAEARRLSLSRNLLWLRFARGEADVRVPSVEEAEQYPYSTEERAFLNNKFQRAIIGNPAQVKQGIEQLADEFGADEIMTVTITYDFAARLHSYTLLAEAFSS